MIVLITIHDSSCFVCCLPFVRQFDSAPQTNGVHRIRSSVRRFTCTARTCKDCRKRLMLYLYTLPRFDLHACTERICLQGRTKCPFCLVRCKVILLFTLCIVWALYCMPFMQPPALCCIILHHMQEPTQRPTSFAIIQQAALSSLLAEARPLLSGAWFAVHLFPNQWGCRSPLHLFCIIIQLLTRFAVCDAVW